MADFSPKLQSSMQQRGGRHYQGRRLYAPAPWNCPACETPQSGPVEEGCANDQCRAGRPELSRIVPPAAPPPHLTRETHTNSPVRQPLTQAAGRPHLATQRRQPAGGLDVDVLVARLTQEVASLLDARFSGGLSVVERTTICEALDILAAMFEGGELDQPDGVLTPVGIRSLIDRLTPDDTFGAAPDAASPFPEFPSAGVPSNESDPEARRSSSRPAPAPGYRYFSDPGADDPGAPDGEPGEPGEPGADHDERDPGEPGPQ